MRALGLDIGDRRIGVAVSDPTGLVARPLTVLRRRSEPQVAEAVQALIDELRVDVVVVGIPLLADGTRGRQAEKTLAFVRYLQRRLTRPVETWDERFSTQDAERELVAMGVRRRRRREMLDAAAAAVMLDDWLTARRARPTPSM
ncbi:MAG TPA: Holliday junction resolvase RuvX [Chloroflexota bacterium]|nr:Holliday junction resolvase RuvX [Chloroflexota bacterium]